MKRKEFLEDLRKLKPEELREKIVGLEKDALNLQFQAAGGQLRETASIKNTKKQIATINTVITELEKLN